MRTSRISKQTSQALGSFSPSKANTRRRTRSVAASIGSNAPNWSPEQGSDLRAEVANDLQDEPSESPNAIGASVDIEDFSIAKPTSKKRKRGQDNTGIALTGTSTNIVKTTASVGKPNTKVEIDSPKAKITKERRQPARKTVNDAGEVEIQPPSNWEQIYDAVKEMRKTVLAPVDTMGCETLADDNLSERDRRFQTLIALMLSSQTKDTTNAIAMRNLQTVLPYPGLTLENILAVDPVKLNELIYVVGFHNNKTRYIKATAIILRDNFNGDIPDTIEGLISLPGVGPKMAYLCLSAAWGRTEGIGVDVHVHRITNLWSWHRPKTQMPEQTRASLESWLPKDKWHEINHLLVGFGQTICLPVGRRCEKCTLSHKKLCPSAVKSKDRKVVEKLKNEVVGGSLAKRVEDQEVTVKAENADNSCSS